MATGTRDLILRSLRSQGERTVKELAEIVGISPVSVRHHLTSLQADGLVKVKEVRQGVGRPHHVFLLTDEALELFPTRYLRLVNRLLDEIKDSISDDKVEELFLGIADSMAESYAQQVKGLPLPDRLRRLVDLLSEEGFDAELEEVDERIIIREFCCPYLKLAQDHPEVCVLEQDFIARALSVPVERITWLAKGDTFCAFAVSPSSGELSQ
ncbi:MAG: ArsR family transcriptional regulator [Anaerolineales bacterium]|nr:ArsR family transcriptional regulator [Anaerolineales bacterium]